LPPRLILGVLLFALVSRLAHLDVIWIEEAYPSAAAINILHGRLPYFDFWFDKPPLSAYLYCLWGGEPCVPLRLAGALYVSLCAVLMARVARSPLAGLLLLFFLTFDHPGAALVLGPDMLTIAPVLGAVLCRDRRPVLAGIILAIGFQANTKAILFLPLLWSWRSVAGFAAAALPAFWFWNVEQVWSWGAAYARDTFLKDPLGTGLAKSAAWLGFHAPLVVLAMRAKWDRTVALWVAAALLCVVGGLRFFPRYYFHLLPPLCLIAARGFDQWGGGRWPRWRWTALALLIIPLVRYAPAYWHPERSRDLAMFRDSQLAVRLMEPYRRPGDTIFVWGYRPDIDMLTRLPGGTPYLESQPLTGVFADRHLSSSKVNPGSIAPAQDHRARLARTRPAFVVDGLGRYNPELAPGRYPDLAAWLRQYREIGRTNGTIIYRLTPAP
jgi:hypothetical protein